MSVESIVGMISVGATITFAVAGGAIWVCAKLERLHVAVTALVSHEQCSERRRKCRLNQRRNLRKD